MQPSTVPGTGQALAGVLWACVLGGLAGLFHAAGAPWAHVGTAVALGAALGISLAPRTAGLAGFWSVAWSAVVNAVCARFYAGWALSRNEPPWQRCSFVLAVLGAGARLWVTRAVLPAAPADPPRPDGGGPSRTRTESIDGPTPSCGPCEARPAPPDEPRAREDDPGGDAAGRKDPAAAAPALIEGDAAGTTACPEQGRRRVLLLW